MSATTARAEPFRQAGEADLPVSLRLARQLAREGRIEEAESVLERARAASGDPAEPAKELARLLQAQRRYGEAEVRWRTIVETAPHDVGALQGLVRTMRLHHRLVDAARTIGEALARTPGSRLLVLEAARLAAQREVYSEAGRRYRQALALPGPTAEVLDELATVEMAQHRFAAAEAILMRLIEAEPKKPAWRATLARVAEERGDLELAIRRWNEVLELDHGHLRAGIAIGRLVEEFGRLGEAEAIFRDLTETHPHAIEPYYQLGRMALLQSDLEGAVRWLERALAIQPLDWAAGAALARATAEQHRFAQAGAMARTLAERMPDHLDAHLLVAWVEERAGRIRAAERRLRRTQDAFPQAFLPALKLAELLIRDERPAAAREALEAARAANPDTFSLRLALVDACFASGDDAAAARSAEALYEDYPEHREVKKRIARIEVVHGRYGPARRLWAEVTRHDRRVSGPPLHLERLDGHPIPEPSGEIRLFTRIRNERLRLPWLFDFYRSQGVDRFFVVDNGSDDGSRDYLLSRPDTHLFLTTDSYAVYGGGQRWLNHLLNRYGSGTWCLTVDVDEVLAYPHAERLDLKALTGHLDRQGAEALFTFMLDMYADGNLGEVAYHPGDNPLRVCPCFDRAGYIHRAHPDFPFRMVVGGLISRFLFERKQDGVFLHKVPLVRWRRGLHYTGSTHTLFPVPVAAETGVLLHLKYMADFADRARIESQRKQYWRGARRYTEFTRRFEDTDVIDFRCELTERFTSTRQLMALGLIRSSPVLDALAATLPRDRRLPGWPSSESMR
ncbi:tetratricopeptide repeat protein [Benzoatithermus flavus]|uniref:Tetratricopeptide repeat protein n=1 Tax=Benzoatithermus flavus TaxID=3108223 RepID=A0ABU8XX39_9PROT